MLRTRNVLSFSDFSGGINTKASPLNLAENESPCCINVHTDVFKSLKKRSGQLKLTSTPFSQLTCNGLYDFYAGGSDRILSCWDGYIYADSSAINTTNTSSLYQFDNFITADGASHLIACNEAHDQPVTWDGSAGSTTSIAAAPKGSSPKVYMAYCLMNGIAASPSTIQFSALGDYTTWPAAYYYVEPTSDGEGFNGWATLQGTLYAVKPHSLFRMSYTGSSPLFSRRQVTNMGYIAPRTIQNVVLPSTGEVVVGLAPNGGLYAFDGTNMLPISIKIETDNGIAPVSLGTAVKNVSILKNAWAVNIEDLHWYVLCFTNKDSAGVTNNVGIVWDYYSNSFWPFSNMNFLSGAMMNIGTGQKNLIMGGYNGNGYWFNSGNDDDGSPISSYYFTRKADSKTLVALKKPSQTWVTTKVTGDYTLGVQYRLNWNSSWINTENVLQNNGEYFLGTTFTLGTAILGGSEAVTRVFDLPNLQNLIQYKVYDNSTNPAWNLLSIDIPEDSLGYAKA
jgi:hypothetical protein